MRRFSFILAVFALLVTVGVTLLYNGGLRGSTTLRDPKIPLRAAKGDVQCVRVTVVSSDRDLARVTHRPVKIRLRPDSSNTWASRVWYSGDFIPADSSAPRVRWAPYSEDSRDLNIETFPIAVHLRFHRHGADSAARFELWDDMGYITPSKDPAFVVRIPCSLVGIQQRPSNER